MLQQAVPLAAQERTEIAALESERGDVAKETHLPLHFPALPHSLAFLRAPRFTNFHRQAPTADKRPR